LDISWIGPWKATGVARVLNRVWLNNASMWLFTGK